MANTNQSARAAQADNQAQAAAAVALPQAGAKFRISAARTEQQAKDVTEADNGLLILTSDTQQVYLAGKKFGGGLTDNERQEVSNMALKIDKCVTGASFKQPDENSETENEASLILKTTSGDITVAVPVIAGEGSPAVGMVNGSTIAYQDDLDKVKSTVAALSRQLNPLKLTVGGGGTFEKGSTQSPTFTWAITNGGDSPTVTVKVNNVVKEGATSPLKLTDVKADTTVAVTVAAKDGQTASGQATAGFTNPVYFGRVNATTAAPDAAAIKAGLMKVIAYTKVNQMPDKIPLTNQKLWYAYPASYGDLTGAKDLGVNMDGLSGFQKTVVKVTTLAGEELNYNVYTMKDAVTANARYVFS